MQRTDTPTDRDEVTHCALDVEASACRLLAALDGYDRTMPPAALTALQHTVAVLEEFAGKAGDTLHAMAVSRESDLWDRTAVHLYNAAADLHDGQALLAAAQETPKKALTEDSGDVDSDG